MAQSHWQADADVSNCPICNVVFGFFVRKHHCRRCGRVLCEDCAPHRYDGNAVYLGKYIDERVCHPCFDILTEQSAFRSPDDASDAESVVSFAAPRSALVAAAALDPESTTKEQKLLDLEDLKHTREHSVREFEDSHSRAEGADDVTDGASGREAYTQQLIQQMMSKMAEYEKTIHRLSCSNADLGERYAEVCEQFGVPPFGVSERGVESQKALEFRQTAYPLVSKSLTLAQENADNVHLAHTCASMFEVSLQPEPGAKFADYNMLKMMGISLVRAPFFGGNRHNFGYFPQESGGLTPTTGSVRLARLTDPTDGLSPLFPHDDVHIVAPYAMAVGDVTTTADGSLAQKYNATTAKDCVCQRIRPGLLLTHVNGRSMAGVNPVSVIELISKASFPISLGFMSHPLAALQFENQTLQTRCQLYRVQLETCSNALSKVLRRAATISATSNKKLKIIARAYKDANEERLQLRHKVDEQHLTIHTLTTSNEELQQKVATLTSKYSNATALARQYLARAQQSGAAKGSRNLLSETSGYIPRMSFSALLESGGSRFDELDDISHAVGEGQSGDKGKQTAQSSREDVASGSGSRRQLGQDNDAPADGDKSILAVARDAWIDKSAKPADEPTIMVALDPLYPEIRVPLPLDKDGKPVLPDNAVAANGSPLFTMLTRAPDAEESAALRELAGYIRKLSTCSHEIKNVVAGTLGPEWLAERQMVRRRLPQQKKKKQVIGSPKPGKLDAIDSKMEDALNLEHHHQVEAYQVLHAYMQRDTAIRFAEEALTKFATAQNLRDGTQAEFDALQAQYDNMLEKVDILERVVVEYHDELQAAGIDVHTPITSVPLKAARAVKASQRRIFGQADQSAIAEEHSGAAIVPQSPSPSPPPAGKSGSALLKKFVSAATHVSRAVHTADMDALQLWDRYKQMHQRATVLEASFQTKSLEYDTLKQRLKQCFLHLRSATADRTVLDKEMQQLKCKLIATQLQLDAVSRQASEAQQKLAAVTTATIKPRGFLGLKGKAADKPKDIKEKKLDDAPLSNSTLSDSKQVVTTTEIVGGITCSVTGVNIGGKKVTKSVTIEAAGARNDGSDSKSNGKLEPGDDSDEDVSSIPQLKTDDITGPNSLKPVAPRQSTRGDQTPTPSFTPRGTPVATPASVALSATENPPPLALDGAGAVPASTDGTTTKPDDDVIKKKKSFGFFGRREETLEDDDPERVDKSLKVTDILLDRSDARRALDEKSSACPLSGTLYKRSRKNAKAAYSKWEQRHVELRSGYCMYFKPEVLDKPVNFFKLSDLLVVRPLKPGLYDKEFVVECELRGGKRYHFAVADRLLRDTWCSMLTSIALQNREGDTISLTILPPA